MPSALLEVGAHPTAPLLSVLHIFHPSCFSATENRDTFLMCLFRSQPWFWHDPLDHVSFASTRKEWCSAFLRGLPLNWYSWTLRGSCLAPTPCWSRAAPLWLPSLMLPVSLFWRSGRWVSTIPSRVSTTYANLSLWQLCMSQMIAYKMTSEGVLKPQHVFCSYTL